MVVRAFSCLCLGMYSLYARFLCGTLHVCLCVGVCCVDVVWVEAYWCKEVELWVVVYLLCLVRRGVLVCCCWCWKF